ncbi:DoxX family protein [Kribbella deserti]|uniref:DoxX family protein n=1 Tax=Kribbella deserti TaxID=1926257 RepID=A0ABV6QM44_9ACTN
MSALSSLSRPVNASRDLVLLVARVGLGVIFIAHGWQKFKTNGLDGTTAGFTNMGIPQPQISAYFATFVELVGGAALIVGALTTLFGLLLTVNMAGAFLFVHRENGVFAADGGWELVAALGLLSLTLAVVGAGKFSLDGLFRSAPNRSMTMADARN